MDVTSLELSYYAVAPDVDDSIALQQLSHVVAYLQQGDIPQLHVELLATWFNVSLKAGLIVERPFGFVLWLTLRGSAMYRNTGLPFTEFVIHDAESAFYSYVNIWETTNVEAN